jgi:hypothetical protein
VPVTGHTYDAGVAVAAKPQRVRSTPRLAVGGAGARTEGADTAGMHTKVLFWFGFAYRFFFGLFWPIGLNGEIKREWWASGVNLRERLCMACWAPSHSTTLVFSSFRPVKLGYGCVSFCSPCVAQKIIILSLSTIVEVSQPFHPYKIR